MDKRYISPAQLLEDSFDLAWRVFDSGYRPSWVVGIWRGGTPVGIAVHELLDLLGVRCDHTAIRSASYTGMARRGQSVQVDGLDYLGARLGADDQLLLVDDVHDTGLTLQQIILELRQMCGADTPEIRIAVPWFKPRSNQTGQVPDYFIHQTDEWLVFPHELDGLSVDEMRANKPALAALMDRLEQALK